MKSCSIIIVSYGVAWWRDLAINRALPSARAQGDHEIIHIHRPDPATNLSLLRNEAADIARGEFLVFLDADDELEPGYIDAMSAIDGDVRIPMLRCLIGDPRHDNPLPDPIELVPRPLLQGNYIVIGAAIRRQLFYDIGGFDDFESAEDWPVWVKCWIRRASMQLASGAVYRQNWREGSRNQMEHKQYSKICETIRNRYTPLAQAAGVI